MPASPIVAASVREVAMPLLRPFVTGFGATTSRRTVVVHVADADGAEGWGEAPALDHPYYLPETTATTFEIVREYALPLALRSGRTDPAGVAAAMAPIRGNTFARAGVEAAFWALTSLRTGRCVRDLLGGTAERVPVGESIGIAGSIAETLDEVALRLREGYRRIKLKIRPGWDVEPVRAVREAVGPDVALQVDANASYTLADADTLGKLDDFDLLCVEQPLGYDDLLGSAALQRRLATPVCLDEALRSVEDVRRALDIDACRNVNIKPARIGGLSAAVRAHDLCAERGIPVWCGGMLESGIGRAGNLALCALPGFTEPADMSPASVLFEEDLVDPTYTVDADGFISVPTEPGLGFPVAVERLRRRTLRVVEFDPGEFRSPP